MKKITLLVIMIVTAFTLNAQSLVKYHGEINAGYSVGIGTFATLIVFTTDYYSIFYR